jgi:hypothetical protein
LVLVSTSKPSGGSDAISSTIDRAEAGSQRRAIQIGIRIPILLKSS